MDSTRFKDNCNSTNSIYISDVSVHISPRYRRFFSRKSTCNMSFFVMVLLQMAILNTFLKYIAKDPPLYAFESFGAILILSSFIYYSIANVVKRIQFYILRRCCR